MNGGRKEGGGQERGGRHGEDARGGEGVCEEKNGTEGESRKAGMLSFTPQIASIKEMNLLKLVSA